MTQEQRLNHRCERTYEMLVDHMAAVRERNLLTYDDVAECLNVSRSTVAKIFHQQPVTISTDTFCRMLEFAGLELKPKGGERNGV